jgi:hypothetical protein
MHTWNRLCTLAVLTVLRLEGLLTLLYAEVHESKLLAPVSFDWKPWFNWNLRWLSHGDKERTDSEGSR